MPELFHYMQQLVNGLTIGSTYALIAIGYTMVYGIIGMINFAHGDLYMIGAYIGLVTLSAVGVQSGLPVWAITVALGMVLRALSGQGVAVAFVIVATITLAVFLLGWRGIARLAARRRRA